MDLLDSLLGISPSKPKLQCKIDMNTTARVHTARRCYGGYVTPKPVVASLDPSLFKSNADKEYEEMIEDMTKMSLLRSKGLLAEKRTSRYEKAMKAKSGSKK